MTIYSNKSEPMYNDYLADEGQNNEDQELVIDERSEKNISWQTKDFSIREFVTMKGDGELIIQPSNQRNYVATEQIASALIESVIMCVPIPAIYLAEEKDGSFSVIDGQQRLTTFISFIEGRFPDGKEFRLKGLKILKELNRKSFSDLDIELKKKIRSTTLHSIIIKKESSEDIKFDIFERLNTGSTKLNEDELRNNVYRGPYIELLKELEENETFHRIVNKDEWKKRMEYRGMILRFFAISERSYINYQSPMKQFCNVELRDNRYMIDSKQDTYRQRFLHCLEMVDLVFGDKAFRKYVRSKDGKEGYWSQSQLSMALFDMQMVGFRNFTKAQILSKKDQIFEGVVDLMSNNTEFEELILIRTSNTDNVKRRFRIYMDLLENIIESPTDRFYPFSIKERLFNSNPTCAISGQRILKIEDCEVDHILPYSMGGKTTIENAQIVLRYFNRAKKNNPNYKIEP